MTFRPKILSRHPTHNILRGALPRVPFRCVIRFGSITQRPTRVQVNRVEAIQNAWNKLKMKQCFRHLEVKTADWNWGDPGELKYPIVAKHIMSSKGRGVYRFKTQDEYQAWKEANNPDLTKFIFEKFHDYGKEYRLHVTEEGCFYACRKLRRNGTAKEQRWKFSAEAGADLWILETNPKFEKPEFWDDMVGECVKALKAVGLDTGACDVKVSKDSFFVLEINSAPSFGEKTGQKYLEILPSVIQKAHERSLSQLNPQHNAG